MPKKTEVEKDAIQPVLNEIGSLPHRQNSLGYVFMHGIVRGMGTALGATLLVAFITSVTLYFAESPQAATFLHYLLQIIE